MLSRRAWIVFLAAGALLLGVYLFVPPLEGSGPLMNVLGLAPVLAILAGIRLHEPRARAAWSCFAIGFTLFWLGDLYTYSYPLLLDRDVPFPSLGDAAYLLVYPALIAGLVVLERRRTRGSDRGSAIDAAIMTVGLALPSWIWLMVPYLHDDTLSTVGRFVSVAYPLADVLLLAVAVRLALDGGQRRPAFHLMCASIICLLVTDFVYGLMILHGTYDHQLWLDAGWIGFYLLWGAAALHPSMSDIDEPAVKRGEGLTRFRLALLTGASLIAPTMGMVHDLSVGDYDFAVVRAASITLFGLVILRMAGLMRQQERSLERERMLSASGTDLVAAAGRDEIDQVALSAARALAGPDLMTLVRSAGSDAALDAALLEAARDGEVVRLRVDALAALGLPGDHNRALVLDLAPPHRERRLLVAAGRTAPPEAIRASLRALASQVALALERASLTEEIHRRRGEARFGSLVRHASDLITVIGPDGKISYQSPSVERSARLRAVGGDRPPVRGARPRLGRRARARDAGGRRVGRPGTSRTSCSARSSTATARRSSSRSTAPTSSTTSTSAASSSTAATSASARPSRSSSRIRPSTTRSPGSPTAPCSPSECATRSRATGASTAGSRSCSSTWTTSRRSTTASGTPPATRCSRWSRSGLRRASARATPPPASAATSSRCCSRTSTTSSRRPTRRSACWSRLRCRCGWPTRSSRCAAASASRWSRRTPRRAPRS